MADSTEDLRREMEEFEKSEAATEAPAASPPVAGPPAQRRVPAWVYWMVAVDVVIAVIVVVVVLAM